MSTTTSLPPAAGTDEPGSPLDRDVALPRGPHDVYRQLVVSDAEVRQLRALVAGRVGRGVRLPAADGTGRSTVWVFAGGEKSIDALELLGRLRGHALTDDERAWASTDPLAHPAERRLREEIDALVGELSTSLRRTPTPDVEARQEPSSDVQARERLRAQLARARAQRPARQRRSASRSARRR